MIMIFIRYYPTPIDPLSGAILLSPYTTAGAVS